MPDSSQQVSFPNTGADAVAREVMDRHDVEFKNLWQTFTANQKENDARSTRTDNQITSLTKDVQQLTGTVNKLAGSFDNYINVISERLRSVEKPNINLWLQVAMLVFVMGGGLWVTAIRPVQMAIESVAAENKALRVDIQTIQQTRWTKADSEAALKNIIDQRELIIVNERKITDMEIAHQREVADLKFQYIQDALDRLYEHDEQLESMMKGLQHAP